MILFLLMLIDFIRNVIKQDWKEVGHTLTPKIILNKLTILDLDNNIRAMIEKRLIFHLIEKIEKKSERNTTSVALNIIFIDEKNKKEVEHNSELQQFYISK